MRKLYWYLTTYFRKHGWVLAGSVVAALILFSLFIPQLAQKLEMEKKHYIGVVGRYNLETLPRFIQEQISAGLTKVEADDTVSPYLAERWTRENGGRTYRFVIKKGVKWQDGKELVPSDINYNFPDLEIIATPNDLVFKLPDEYVPFPSIVSAPVFRIQEERYLLFFKRPMLIGIGPYVVENYQRNRNNQLTQITLDGPDEKLVYRFYLTEDEAVTAFKLGEIDELPNLSESHGLDEWDNTTLNETIHFDRYLGLFFNNASPLLGKNVRQALAYAATKPTGKLRATTPINPNSWAYLEGGKSYEKDLSRASERLLSELPPEPLNLELTTTSIFITEAEQLKQDWEEFGRRAYQDCVEGDEVEAKEQCVNAQIKINIRVTNFPDTNNFQTLLIGQEIPPDPDQYHLWHSEQSTNFTNYKNTRIDALLENGRKTAEKNERRAIYQEFQQFLLEDAPVIFLKHLKSYEIKRS